MSPIRKHPTNTSLDSSEALLHNISIHTPSTSPLQPFRFNIAPHPSLAVQSVTLNLPSTYSHLHLEPTLSAALSSGTRLYKLFVTVNGTRVQPSSLFAPMQSVGNNEAPKTLFDVKLLPGMNRVEVECGAPNGRVPVAGGGWSRTEHLDVERVTAFVHLMRG